MRQVTFIQPGGSAQPSRLKSALSCTHAMLFRPRAILTPRLGFKVPYSHDFNKSIPSRDPAKLRTGLGKSQLLQYAQWVNYKTPAITLPAKRSSNIPINSSDRNYGATDCPVPCSATPPPSQLSVATNRFTAPLCRAVFTGNISAVIVPVRKLQRHAP